jgi:adenylylsulfate kinase-like enzyme
MIVVLFGQPGSGKTTICNALNFVNIDGDKLRDMFKNTDYSREGRIKNLNRASDIAFYLSTEYKNISLSLVYPYKEARDYLNSLSDNVKWIYLHYDGERGREKFHVSDFELHDKENILSLNTSKYSVEECINQINSYINE